jgi:hypothetical protein
MKHKTILIIMPTENISTLGQPISNLEYCEKGFDPHVVHNFNLYATVSQDVEPIKEDDWYLNCLNQITIHQYKGEKLPSYGCVKIIATSDLKLKSTISIGIDGTSMFKTIPQLQQSLLKEFVANPDGEFEVEYSYKGEQHDESSTRNTFHLKLNQNNTVTITSVKEKMYSAIDLMGNQNGSFDHFLLHSSKFSQEEREVIMDAVYDWIKKNL